MQPSRDIQRLLEIMAALRTPKTGCPWDLEQDFRTIAPYTLEEAYEVADAIERNDRVGLKEELGDLLLQVVYHAQIAREEGVFAFEDVVDGITAKMIRRHPHVFGTPEQRAAGIGPGFWERIKAEERAQKRAEQEVAAANGIGPSSSLVVPAASSTTAPSSLAPRSTGVLDDVPAKFPALTRAVKLQAKAAKVGFDWPSLAPVLAKMREELAEFEAEVAALDRSAANAADPRSGIEEEFGDLLFVLANVARWLEIDPESAARRANSKFERRFRRIEALLAERGKTPAQSDLAEMDALWEQAKREERQRT